MSTRFGIDDLAVRLTLALLCVGAAQPARAQIYTWRDANGNLVLSNRRTSGEAPVRSYAVPAADKVRTTRYAEAGRSRAFEPLIQEHARRNGIRPDLVRAVMQVESAFDPRARSPKGAMGLMQLMPATMRQFGVKDAYDPADNVRAGAAYLRELLDRYEGNEALALAAYNAGPGAVDRYGAAVPPYRETREYLERVGRAAAPLPRRPASVIYKVTDMVNGHPQTRYTDQKPSGGPYEIIGGRQEDPAPRP
ncbi:MAG: lytic transglycosylase domain-containing protein [Acidobacteria bacterium]|nr:lytic transglycosylase domain-containing protein [Acidobacteriota bacterium]